MAAARALFDPAPGTIYLDSATYGLPPRPTVEVMQRAVNEWQAGTADWVRAWDVCGEACRASFGALVGVPAESVALVPSASVGVGTIAASLTSADRVVVPDDEFTSLLFPILVAARERGVQVQTVPFERLAESVKSGTTIVAFSLVQSQSGRTADLEAIVKAARAVEARTLVDATHAIPFVPIDQPVDYLVCAAYKHLLCPRGVAFMYIAQDRWDDVAPWLANWRSTSNPYGQYYGGPLDLASTAARFDVSLAWFPWAGAAESLKLLVDWQREALLHEVVGLARRLTDNLGLPAPGGAVVGVPVEDAEAVRADLAAAGIKAAVRAGSVRLSPHVYNTEEQIDRAASALARRVPQAARR